ncbi:hypothetical protein HPB50_000869 [Hyalomma asiaticum]|uniref:Uncharacterized protein n=1 Tax=Hyalomma asiaticum TaxID=266040 RepID=A0ACB7S749_HYAAI|nr:hypothetical protein HPB50_000869 [Hyalomma asiaticum]
MAVVRRQRTQAPPFPTPPSPRHPFPLLRGGKAFLEDRCALSYSRVLPERTQAIVYGVFIYFVSFPTFLPCGPTPKVTAPKAESSSAPLLLVAWTSTGVPHSLCSSGASYRSAHRCSRTSSTFWTDRRHRLHFVAAVQLVTSAHVRLARDFRLLLLCGPPLDQPHVLCKGARHYGWVLLNVTLRHAASVTCKGGVAREHHQQRRCLWSSPRPAVPSSLRLNHAIQCAEKLTGHNTSRFSEKLMNMGELHTFLGTVAKMMGSQHPIVDSVKQLLFQQSTNIQTRGLLVSLFIKACGVAECHADPLDVVLRRQQLVVNATEEFHAAQTIHASALNVAAAERDRLDPLVLDDVQTGNKMTVLAGDYFFAKAFQTTTDIGIPVVRRPCAEST